MVCPIRVGPALFSLDQSILYTSTSDFLMFKRIFVYLLLIFALDLTKRYSAKLHRFQNQIHNIWVSPDFILLEIVVVLLQNM